jgi:hypothetical protein
MRVRASKRQPGTEARGRRPEVLEEERLPKTRGWRLDYIAGVNVRGAFWCLMCKLLRGQPGRLLSYTRQDMKDMAVIVQSSTWELLAGNLDSEFRTSVHL